MCIAFLPFNMVELRTCEIGWSCLQVDSASQLKPAQEILAVVSSGSKVASIAVMGQSSDTRKIWDYWKGALLPGLPRTFTYSYSYTMQTATVVTKMRNFSSIR